MSEPNPDEDDAPFCQVPARFMCEVREALKNHEALKGFAKNIQWGPFTEEIEDRASITLNITSITPEEETYDLLAIGPCHTGIEVILDGPFGVVTQEELFCKYFQPIVETLTSYGARFQGAVFSVVKQGQDVSNLIKINFRLMQDDYRPPCDPEDEAEGG